MAVVNLTLMFAADITHSRARLEARVPPGSDFLKREAFFQDHFVNGL